MVCCPRESRTSQLTTVDQGGDNRTPAPHRRRQRVQAVLLAKLARVGRVPKTF